MQKRFWEISARPAVAPYLALVQLTVPQIRERLVLMRYVFAWVALALVIALGGGSLNWVSFRRLTAHGIMGQGVVLALTPEIHNTVRYEYYVDGRRFEGQTQLWPPNPPLDRLRVGQSLIVCYDPEHPENSVLGNPIPILENETISIALAALLVPTSLVGVWAWHGRKTATQPKT
jgi:hypothetical protein